MIIKDGVATGIVVRIESVFHLPTKAGVRNEAVVRNAPSL